MTIQISDNFSQPIFNKWVHDLQETVMTGRECQMVTLSGTLMVDGYWDFDDEGKSSPHFWYNKKELDKRGIKYEV